MLIPFTPINSRILFGVASAGMYVCKQERFSLFAHFEEEEEEVRKTESSDGSVWFSYVLVRESSHWRLTRFSSEAIDCFDKAPMQLLRPSHARSVGSVVLPHPSSQESHALTRTPPSRGILISWPSR